MQYRIFENTHTHHFSGKPPAYQLDEFESGNEKNMCDVKTMANHLTDMIYADGLVLVRFSYIM